MSFIQALREVINIIRNQKRNRDRNRSRSSSGNDIQILVTSAVLCCAECLLKMVEDLMTYINRFSFCYVAAYGYGFVESGQKVYELFKRR